MTEVNIVCWKWVQEGYRTRFKPEYVNVFANMIKRNAVGVNYRLICITDDPKGVTECETYPLWDDFQTLENPSGCLLPNCYRRLRIFDGATTRAMGIPDGDLVMSVDLDAIFINPIRSLINHHPGAAFVGWRGIGTYRPVVYNGSLFKFPAGAMQHLYSDFDPVMSPRVTRDHRYYGSDQAWISYKIDGTMPGFDVEDGVYSYSRDVRRKDIPGNAVVVFFNGKHKPWDDFVQIESPWIRDFWH